MNIQIVNSEISLDCAAGVQCTVGRMKLKKTVTYCIMGNSLCVKYSTKVMPQVSENSKD